MEQMPFLQLLLNLMILQIKHTYLVQLKLALKIWPESLNMGQKNNPNLLFWVDGSTRIGQKVRN